MKRLIACFVFVCMCVVCGRAYAIDPECHPHFRTDIDTLTAVGYQGSLRESSPLSRDKCERKEGLIFADDSFMDYFGKVHYVPLYYRADKGEPDSKFDGLVFPLDLTAEIEYDKRDEDYQYSHFSIAVNVREKLNANFLKDDDSVPLLIRADKNTIVLKSAGWEGGKASFGVEYILGFELTPESMRKLLSANKYSFILPFTHNRTEKEKERFTVRLNLTDEGAAELKKFIKVALKYADMNETLIKKYKAK